MTHESLSASPTQIHQVGDLVRLIDLYWTNQGTSPFIRGGTGVVVRAQSGRNDIIDYTGYIVSGISDYMLEKL